MDAEQIRCEDCGGPGHLECDRMPADGGERYSLRPQLTRRTLAATTPREGSQDDDE